MRKQEQKQPGRAYISIYVKLVIGGMLLLFGGLVAVYSYSALFDRGSGAGFQLACTYAFIVFPLFIAGSTLFLMGLRGLAKNVSLRQGSKKNHANYENHDEDNSRGQDMPHGW